MQRRKAKLDRYTEKLLFTVCLFGTLHFHRQLFREKDDKVTRVVSSFSMQKSRHDQLSISDELIADIERIFLSQDIIDPGSDLMKTISRPFSFPKDQIGKVEGLQMVPTY